MSDLLILFFWGGDSIHSPLAPFAEEFAQKTTAPHKIFSFLIFCKLTVMEVIKILSAQELKQVKLS